MNPYDFVRVPDIRCNRERPILHHRFDNSAYHGRITCNIETLTPLFIPDTSQTHERMDGHKESTFLGTRGMGMTTRGIPHIPGSSIKGVIRSVAEAVGNGCFTHTDNPRKATLPPRVNRSFEACSNANSLCIACRIFGMLAKRSVHKGNVSISDAIIEGNFEMMGRRTLKPLMTPKPRHTAFYNPGGRKFYFHHPSLTQPEGENLTSWTQERQNQYNSTVNPVAPGASFTFEIDFYNLKKDELQLLLYSLVLEPDMRHKIGLAKPLGLGSVHVTIKRLSLMNPLLRYSANEGEEEIYEETKLDRYINDMISNYVNSKTDNLVDLKRIWKWDPGDKTIYRYPTQDWFGNHPLDPISVTP